jgi:hypothetical protein
LANDLSRYSVGVSYASQVMKGMNLHERQGFVTQVGFDRRRTVRNRLH